MTMTAPVLRYHLKLNAWFLIMDTPKFRSIAKNAGFGWHKQIKHFFTYDFQKAWKLREYADDKATLRLYQLQQNYVDSFSDGRDRNWMEDLHHRPPEGLEYLPFQAAGISMCMDRGRIVLLDDEQGLGKAIQAVGVMHEMQALRGKPGPFRVLVICRRTMKFKFKDEIEKWLPGEYGLTCQVVRDGKHILKNHHRTAVIVNYDLMRKEQIRVQLEREWDLVVLDEVQDLSNRKAARTRCVLGHKAGKRKEWRPGVVKEVEKVLVSSGTPILGRPIEFYSVLSRLCPWVLTPHEKYIDYGRRYCAGYEGNFGWDMSGASNEKEFGVKLRTTVMIRRLKKDVLKDLPARYFEIVPLENDPATRRIIRLEEKLAGMDLEDFADEISSDGLTKMGLPKDKRQAGELAKLRREIGLAKLPTCIEYIKDLFTVLDKIVVFAYHRDVISTLTEAFKDYHPVVIWGGTSDKAAYENVKMFQENRNCRLMIGQTDSANASITLTAAGYIVFVEPHWSAGVISQCVDRCHRIGQDSPVTAQLLVVRDSLEEYMMRAVVDKQGTLNAILN